LPIKQKIGDFLSFSSRRCYVLGVATTIHLPEKLVHVKDRPRIARGRAREQRRGRKPEHRMVPARRDVHERAEDERSFMSSWMGESELRIPYREAPQPVAHEALIAYDI
jgi:hypothetical protein